MIKTISFAFLRLTTAFLIASQATFGFAQTASILPQGTTQYLDNNGNPLTGGKVYNYIPGTTTFKNTWQDSAEGTLNSNPVTLDSAGRAKILGEGSYRQIVKKANGDTIWDAVTSASGSGGGGTSTGDGDLVGTVKPWAGITAPNQYAFAYGQELSRTTYSSLLTAVTLTANLNCTSSSTTLTSIADTASINIGAAVEASCIPAGTTVVSKTSSTVVVSNPANITIAVSAVFFPFGNGNGSTTFNVPDLRGYVIAGRDNMGGTPASRLTTAYFGSNTPDAQGATGGSQSNTLATTNLPAYTPSGTIVVTDTRSYTIPFESANVVNTAQSGVNVARSSSTTNVTVGATGTLTAALTGTAQGGAATPISRIQPTITFNYIIKITPDTNSSVASGVTSLGSMTGDIACGTGILCTGNTVSLDSSSGLLLTAHSVAVGTGSFGFVGVGPCVANQSLVWASVSSDPACKYIDNNTIVINPSGDVTGVTDSAAIVAAQTSAASNRNTSITLNNSGQWYLATGITLQSNICINGKGNAYAGSLPTIGTIVNMVGNASAFQVSGTLTPVVGWCLNNMSIVLPPSGTSATGVTVDAGIYGKLNYVTIYVVGPSQIGFLSNPGAAHVNTAWNTIIGLNVSLGGSATNGVGIKLTGQTGGPNTSQNKFFGTNVITSLASHTGFWLAASDTNDFYSTSMFGNAVSAWTAIKFDYSVNAAWPAQTYFYGLEYGYNNTAGASAVINTGSPSGGLAANIIYGLGTTNGNTVPNLTNLYIIGTNVGSLSNGIIAGVTSIPAGSSLSLTSGTLSVGGAFGANTSVLWDAGSGKGFEWTLNTAAAMRLYPSGGLFFGNANTSDPGVNNLTALGSIKTGVTGTSTGQIIFGGATSGTATLTVQAANSSPTVTFGTSSGTPAVTASSPLAITTATGNITCATCLTSSSTLNLVVGTTTISSGTDLRVLYQNGSVLGEYLVTGVGTNVVLSTSPTFTTDLTTPLVKLSAASNQLVFQSGGVTGTMSWTPASTNKTLTWPNGTTDFTGTGGTSRVVMQTSSGGAFTVNRLACADLSDAAATCSSATGETLVIGTTVITGGTTLQVLYNNGGVLGNYTNTQLTALINAATTSLSGALPAWPNNTTTFFRGDGTYAAINLPALASQAANTSVANVTGGSTVPTAVALPSGGTSGCAGAAEAARYTAGTGWSCNTSITAAAVPASGLTGTTLASGVTASSLTSLGTITSLTATTINAFTLGGTIAGGGNPINNIIIGASSPLAGTFTTGTFSSQLISNASDVNLEMKSSGTGTPDWFFQVVVSGGTAGRWRIYDATGIGETFTVFKTTGNAQFFSSTAATSKTAASVVFNGGIGIAGATYTDTLNIITVANASTTRALCWDNTTGLVSENGTVGTCTVSALKYKDRISSLDTKLALDSLAILRPETWNYKKEYRKKFDDLPHIGLYADDVEKMDKRCAVYAADGKLDNYEERCVIAYLVAGVNELKAANDNLRIEIEQIKKKVAR